MKSFKKKEEDSVTQGQLIYLLRNQLQIGIGNMLASKTKKGQIPSREAAQNYLIIIRL